MYVDRWLCGRSEVIKRKTANQQDGTQASGTTVRALRPRNTKCVAIGRVARRARRSPAPCHIPAGCRNETLLPSSRMNLRLYAPGFERFASWSVKRQIESVMRRCNDAMAAIRSCSGDRMIYFKFRKTKGEIHSNSDLAEVYLLTLAKSSKSDSQMLAKFLTTIKFSL
ncbi:uncharacterized protein LOC109611175 isoform X1 [Ooceraea biroi]|uniref:uncharacterized protein LOC109611175 isoform X1 n=1 Tax=Ooceraea biroi TaxID=2015173 RepID=UPI000F082A76|nr:uncharacterized protein LOC109611175 isoform X1 [Ooceraea biroi]